jgi:hypothetical protein
MLPVLPPPFWAVPLGRPAGPPFWAPLLAVSAGLGRLAAGIAE